MANSTVYPYGTGGSLPSSIGIINDLTTGGVDKALSAQQGKVLDDKISQLGLELGDFSEYDEEGYQPVEFTVNEGHYFLFSTLVEGGAAPYQYAKIGVVPGEKYRLSGYNVNANIPLAFVRVDGTTTKARAISQSSAGAMNGEYTIPEGYDTLYVNGRTADPVTIEKWVTVPGSAEKAVDEINAKVGSGDVDVTGYEKQTGTTTSGYYKKLDLTEVESANYEFVTLPVRPDEKYYIEGWNVSSAIPVCIFANSATSASTRGMYNSASKSMNGIVTVPTGYDTMYVNGNVYMAVPVVIEKEITGDNLTDATKIVNANVNAFPDIIAPLYVQMHEKEEYAGAQKAVNVEIVRRFDETNDVVWRFENKTPTPNTFFDFRLVGLVPRGTRKIQDFITTSTVAQIVGAMSDFISPICVAAVNNADGDFPTNTSLFTGGAHGYNNSALSTASATMRQISRSVRLDGIPLSNGDRKYGHVLTIDVVNNIQGCNTEKENGNGREIIQQHIHVQVDRNNVNVGVTFTALESVNIYSIEGLSQVFAFTDIRFIGSTTLRGVYEAGHRAVTEDKHTNTIRNSGDTYYFDVSMDRSFGLAQDGGMADYNAMATIANKGYFHLIGETPLALAADESVSIRGSYEFGKLPATS